MQEVDMRTVVFQFFERVVFVMKSTSKQVIAIGVEKKTDKKDLNLRD